MNVTAYLIALGILATQNPANDPSINPAGRPLDVTSRYGLVYQVPEMRKVIQKPDQAFTAADGATLKFDVFYPPKYKAGQKLPVVVFGNGVGDADNFLAVRKWEIYQSWPKLIAANGMISISHGARSTSINEDIRALFSHLENKSVSLGIDASRIGVFSCSANTTAYRNLVMTDSPKGIKCAVFYYGIGSDTPVRNDLPVMSVLSRKDGPGSINVHRMAWTKAIEAGANWTMIDSPTLPHAFDSLCNTDEARGVIEQTVSFYKTHLSKLSVPALPHSEDREIMNHQFGHDMEKLVPSLQEWLRKNPSDERALSLLSGGLLRARRFADCLNLLESLEKKAPLEPQLIFDKAKSLDALGRTDDAAKCALLYLSHEIHPFEMNQASIMLIKAKMYDQAIRAYAKLIEKAPRFNANNLIGVAHYNTACAQSLLGKPEEALASLNKALDAGYRRKEDFERDPDLAAVRKLPGWDALMKKHG